MSLTTPVEITDIITSFCRQINSACKLSWVGVEPAKGARAGQCYYNVSDQIKNNRGNFAFGWIIWQMPDCFIEAEHHAVLSVAPDEFIDVTPKNDGETRILFLHDPQKSFSFKKPNWRINIRKPINSDPSIQHWLDAKSKLDKFMLRNSRPKGRQRETKISSGQMDHYHKLNNELTNALYNMKKFQ